MPEFGAFAGARMASCALVVTRCGCSAQQKAGADWHGYFNQPCPRPSQVQDLGTVAYWHKNPLRRLVWRLSRLFRS